MTIKEQVKSNIVMAMRIHLDSVTMDILESVLVKEFCAVDFVEMETLPATMTDINEYIIQLYIDKRTNKIKDSTIQYYINTVRQLIEMVNKPLIKMDQNDIELYLRTLKRNGNSNTSLNNRRRNLSAFFTWMRKSKLIQDNPVDAIEAYPAQRKPIESMESEEVELLKEACRNNRERALIEVLRCTACRVGEIPYIHICDINWSNGQVEVYGEKTNEYRLVMLDDIALQYIDFYLQDRGVRKDSKEPLFTHIKGDKTQVLSKDGIYYCVKKLAARSRVEKNIYPHLWRKTTATRIVERGGSDEQAGEYLGHTPRTVTGRHYIQKGPGHVVEIFNRFVRQ